MTIHSMSELRTLADAATIAGVGGTVTVVGIPLDVVQVADTYARLRGGDGVAANCDYADNGRLEWTVTATTRDDVTLTVDGLCSRDEAMAAVGINGVIERNALFYLVGHGALAPIYGNDHMIGGDATVYMSDGWRVIGSAPLLPLLPLTRPEPRAILDGTRVTFTPATNSANGGAFRVNTGVVLSSYRNDARLAADGLPFRYDILPDGWDRAGNGHISRADTAGETVEPEVHPVDVDRDVALAYLNGRGGTLRYRGSEVVWTITPDGRARNAEGDEWTSTDILSGAPGVWTVVSVGMPAPTTPAVDVDQAATPAAIIPRTSSDAHALLETLRTFGDPSTELVAALRTLRTFLPGGKAETAGSEHQQSADLCGQYERIVTPVLGWEPRPSLRGDREYDRRTEFAAEINRAERLARDTSTPPSVAVQMFAERYAAGGPVNDALRDHIVNHLESHKIPGANELLEALGMEPADEEEPLKEFVVYVDLQRTITVTQLVAVRVTATDEDAAEGLVDDEDVYDNLDDDMWTIAENGEGVGRLSTGRYDLDDWSVDYVEEG